MKKSLIAIFFLLMFIYSSRAQEYVVYDVTGNVTYLVKKEKKAVSVRQKFKDKDVLFIPSKGSIRLFDKEQKKLFTLSGKTTGSIKSIIASPHGTEKSLSEKFFAYIIKNLSGNLVTKTCETEHGTNIFRDDLDSLFIDK